jgi:hypothetical protein
MAINKPGKPIVIGKPKPRPTKPNDKMKPLPAKPRKPGKPVMVPKPLPMQPGKPSKPGVKPLQGKPKSKKVGK